MINKLHMLKKHRRVFPRSARSEQQVPVIHAADSKGFWLNQGDHLCPIITWSAPFAG